MKKIVITGASRGIGLALSQQYSEAGWHVYAVCRQASNELRALNIDIVSGIDVSEASAVNTLAEQLRGVEIDVLINNAGILQDEIFGNIDYQSVQTQFCINALGPLRVTEQLRHNFTSNAKVAMITSRMGSLTDNTSGGRYGYRMSKAALNIAAISLAHDLQPQGISVGIIHPGLVGTDMIGGRGDITPAEAASRIIQRIDELTLINSGSFWHSSGEKLPW